MNTPVKLALTSRLFKVLVYLDIFFCSLIFQDPDVTISAVTGLELRKAAPAGWARALGWVLNHIQTNHCELAISNDILRAKAALTLLEGP